jgi:hypothetical protein
MFLPAKTRDYLGPVTNTRIWDSFDLREDDIILSTPPKCGTTWSQAILMMLIQGEAVTDRPIWRESVWLDCGFRDQAELKRLVDTETRRRCIKSHTPFDGLPYSEHVTYITVFRHPIDVHFSMMQHVRNMNADILDFLLCDGSEAAFARFLNSHRNDTGTDDLTLDSVLHHYRSFAKWAHLPNVHFAHYADLTAYLPSEVARYAQIIGSDISSNMAQAIAEAASFGSMKSLTRRELDGTNAGGAFAVPSSFFDSATSNKWEGRLSDAQLAAYHTRFAELATPEEIAFLENGRSGQHRG